MAKRLVGLLLVINSLAATATCVNDDVGCADWASRGECNANRNFMENRCKAACGLCGVDVNALLTSSLGAWSEQRRASLKAALDPDGDGYASYEDFDALASLLVPDRIPQTSPASGLPLAVRHSSSSSKHGPNHGADSINLQETLQDGITFLRGRPPHVDGKKVNSYELSQYYFRAVSKDEGEAADALTAEERKAFECCAAHCLSPEFGYGERCWFIQTYKEGCTIHTGLWKMTSRACR